MKWAIANIDDLTEIERTQLDKYVHYKLFRGLFIISRVDLENWKATEGFDDWVVGVFPEDYINNGWFTQDLDHSYTDISDYIHKNDRTGKLLDKFNLVLDNEHKTKDIKDVEKYILTKLNKWSEKEFIEYNNNEKELYNWLANEISKSVK
jgi:hypothetical protein